MSVKDVQAHIGTLLLKAILCLPVIVEADKLRQRSGEEGGAAAGEGRVGQGGVLQVHLLHTPANI